MLVGLLRGFGFELQALGFGLRGLGLRAAGFGLQGLRVLCLHGGVEVASCIYSGNGGDDLGNLCFLLSLY